LSKQEVKWRRQVAEKREEMFGKMEDEDDCGYNCLTLKGRGKIKDMYMASRSRFLADPRGGDGSID